MTIIGCLIVFAVALAMHFRGRLADWNPRHMRAGVRRKVGRNLATNRTMRDLAFAFARPILAFILALGSLVYLPIAEMAHAQVLAGSTLNNGFSPASMNTSNLPQSQVFHYDKNFIANLKPNTCFLRVCERRELPEMSGNQHVLFMYKALGGNINQAAEGVVGAGITVNVVNNVSAIGQYADYVNLSDMARMTAIDPALENIQKELALRAGLSISTLIRNVADGLSAVDASVNALNLAANVTFSRSTINSATTSLLGRNVLPFSQGTMAGIIHPFIVGDALNDTTAGSVTDLLKRTVEGQEKLSELPVPDGDDVPILDWAGVRFHASTMVTQTANYLASGKVALRTYIVGQNGLIAISLGKKEQAQLGDGDWRNLKLWMYKYDEPSVSDPSRMIGGSTAYNFKFTVTPPPDTTQRIRTIDSVSAIS